MSQGGILECWVTGLCACLTRLSVSSPRPPAFSCCPLEQPCAIHVDGFSEPPVPVCKVQTNHLLCSARRLRVFPCWSPSLHLSFLSSSTGVLSDLGPCAIHLETMLQLSSLGEGDLLVTPTAHSLFLIRFRTQPEKLQVTGPHRAGSLVQPGSLVHLGPELSRIRLTGCSWNLRHVGDI